MHHRHLQFCFGHHRHHRLHRHATPLFGVGPIVIELLERETIHMATSIHIDNQLPLSVAFIDSAGNPIMPAPTPDTLPVWVITDTTVATVTASTDGLTAIVNPLLVGGSTTITLTVVIGGTTFNATLDIVIVAGAVASVQIVAGKPTPIVPTAKAA